jgi:hypothetical protein
MIKVISYFASNVCSEVHQLGTESGNAWVELIDSPMFEKAFACLYWVRTRIRYGVPISKLCRTRTRKARGQQRLSILREWSEQIAVDRGYRLGEWRLTAREFEGPPGTLIPKRIAVRTR